MKGEGPFRLLPGQFTDDTSMALCSLESLIEKRGFDAEDQQERFYSWYERGHLSSTGRCFDIGKQTLFNLQRYQKTKRVYGDDKTESAGNGSIMRILPLILFSYFRYSFDEILEITAKGSALTHSSTVAMGACQYFAALIIGALRGTPKHLLLSPFFHPFHSYDNDNNNLNNNNNNNNSNEGRNGWKEDDLVVTTEELAGIVRGEYKTKSEEEISNGGYVVHTLESVLWVFHHTDSFEEGLIQIVNLGDDADTAGAIFGQLAGVYYGLSSIPSRWISSLTFLPLISSFSTQLYLLAKSSDHQNHFHSYLSHDLENENDTLKYDPTCDIDIESEEKRYKVIKKVYEWLEEKYGKILKKLAPGPGDPRPWPGGYLSLNSFTSDLHSFLSSFDPFLSSLNEEYQLNDNLLNECNEMFNEVKRWLEKDQLLLTKAMQAAPARNALASAILLRNKD